MDTGLLTLLTTTGTEAGNAIGKVNASGTPVNLFFSPALNMDFWLYELVITVADDALFWDRFGDASFSLTTGPQLFVTNDQMPTTNPTVGYRVTPIAADFKPVTAFNLFALGDQVLPLYDNTPAARVNTYRTTIRFDIPILVSGRPRADSIKYGQSLVCRLTENYSTLLGMWVTAFGLYTGRIMQVENLIR